MPHQITQTFPFISLPAGPGRLPVEVCLVACLSPGSGNKLFYEVLARQRAHGEFVDELDEPSAKLGGTNLALGDATALYSFGVGPKGHPFHRHAGHRIFSAISGSGGAQLRFSTATPDDIAANPESFVQALRFVNIPPDCLFTVRFGGETWHQFAPLNPHTAHPAFFALSCHTNELGGQLSEALRQAVVANQASIPALTELLPASVTALLYEPGRNWEEIPVTALFLDNAPESFMQTLCGKARSLAGSMTAALARRRRAQGFIKEAGAGPLIVQKRNQPPIDSLLGVQLTTRVTQHQDCFTVTVPAHVLPGALNAPVDPSALLAQLLEGFLVNPPKGVTRLMQLRNTLVRPLKLRTSSLGCPVSSLLGSQSCSLFAGKYPVLAQQSDDFTAQVILGADDRHLVFRSCVAVRRLACGGVEFSLSTRVSYNNVFGQLYMASISRVHQQYVVPTMLSQAVAHVLHESAMSPGF